MPLMYSKNVDSCTQMDACNVKTIRFNAFAPISVDELTSAKYLPPAKGCELYVRG